MRLLRRLEQLARAGLSVGGGETGGEQRPPVDAGRLTVSGVGQARQYGVCGGEVVQRAEVILQVREAATKALWRFCADFSA